MIFLKSQELWVSVEISGHDISDMFGNVPIFSSYKAKKIN